MYSLIYINLELFVTIAKISCRWHNIFEKENFAGMHKKKSSNLPKFLLLYKRIEEAIVFCCKWPLNTTRFAFKNLS